MAQVRGWGGCGSGCPTSGKVAADCPPRPIGRVREPASEPAIVLSLGLSLRNDTSTSGVDLSRAIPVRAHLQSAARDYPPRDRAARPVSARKRFRPRAAGPAAY